MANNNSGFWYSVLRVAKWFTRKAISKMMKKKDYYGRYMEIHAKLQEKEELLEDAIFKYCTGEDGVRMIDIDNIIKDLKAHMRDVRSLSKEAKTDEEVEK